MERYDCSICNGKIGDLAQHGIEQEGHSVVTSRGTPCPRSRTRRLRSKHPRCPRCASIECSQEPPQSEGEASLVERFRGSMHQVALASLKEQL